MQDRRLEANGLSFFLVDEGDGPPVFLLHGFPDSSRVWRNQITALVNAGFRAVAPDLRGFGQSDKPLGVQDYAMPLILADIDGIMETLGIERAHFVGHDWGAAVAWSYASLHPEQVDHLVVLSVGHPAMFTRPSVEQLQKSWHHLLFQFPDVAEEVLRRDDWHFFREWLDWLGGADDPDRCVDDLARPGALTAALNWYRANALPNLLLADPKAFPSVQAPTLAVFGKFDRTRSEEQVASSAAYVAGPWRFERFEDAGHWVQLEQADRLNRLLVEFLS